MVIQYVVLQLKKETEREEEDKKTAKRGRTLKIQVPAADASRYTGRGEREREGACTHQLFGLLEVALCPITGVKEHGLVKEVAAVNVVDRPP